MQRKLFSQRFENAFPLNLSQKCRFEIQIVVIIMSPMWPTSVRVVNVFIA